MFLQAAFTHTHAFAYSALNTASVLAAQIKSFLCKPEMACVHHVTVSLPHSSNKAGWWPSCSANCIRAAIATRHRRQSAANRGFGATIQAIRHHSLAARPHGKPHIAFGLIHHSCVSPSSIVFLRVRPKPSPCLNSASHALLNTTPRTCCILFSRVSCSNTGNTPPNCCSIHRLKL